MNIFKKLEDIVIKEVFFCFEGNFVVKNEIKGLFVKYKMFDVKLVEL